MKILRSSYSIRRGGFAPALSDEEVITMEICGEFFKHSTDKDLFNYFKAHYQDWFPDLKDRTNFVRQAANLRQFKALIQQQIVKQADQLFANLQVVDTIPLPVCQWVRARRGKCFPTKADYGYCAAK